MPFKKIALAITFSPNSLALLAEAKQLKKKLGAELTLIHIREKRDNFPEAIADLIKKTDLEKNEYSLIVEDGNVEDLLIDICNKEKIDLLIAGALVRESFMKYYVGSIARTLMREAPCSLLLLTNPAEIRGSFKNICVSVDFSHDSEYAARKAYEFALLDNSAKLNFIREFEIPGLAITILDSGSKEETVKQRETWMDEEKQKMKVFINELNLPSDKIESVCLFGKQGWEACNWIHENKGDLFIIPAPSRKSTLIDRIFQHDWEFVFKELPCSLLIVKPTNQIL